MGNPLFSIIVPAHNGDAYLPRLVSCIRSQPGPETELILVDDSSTDCTAAVCEDLARQDSGIRVLHVNFRDVSLTRNAGLDIAEGDYVMFPDCDDLLAPNTLSDLAQIVRRHRPDLVRYGFRKVFSGREELWCPQEENGLYQADALRPLKLDAICFADVLDYSRPRMQSPCANLFSRDFLNRNNLRFVPVQQILNEDYLSVMQTMWKAESVYVCREPYYQYLLHGNSLSTSPRPDMYGRKQKLFQIYRDFLPADDPQVQLRLRNFYIDCIYNCFVEVCLTASGQKAAVPQIRPLLEDPLLQQFLKQNRQQITSAKTKIICFLMAHKMARSMYLLYGLTTKFLKK